MKPADLAGSRVMVAYDRSRRGRVVRAGPEQSEVRLDGEKHDRVFPNEQLVLLRLRATSRSRRRE
mgnify:CR=1 FL=1